MFNAVSSLLINLSFWQCYFNFLGRPSFVLQNASIILVIVLVVIILLAVKLCAIAWPLY